ncbi:metal dependent phosphohydrolase [Clostridium aceticum]|uniref:Metal dependent phosphohydrolase n=1 Tax=Clostridium aceticum TaxID=84022 RepID=A0A0D8II12_9CLOT|nr:HD domain-containing phosphohydrolase [Clostridium aceticum]AKL95389.1 metal dependent phosphohydrolase [Clostridium aceticum]KJF28806.1 hypothetical protein TZ02_00170 [Clostridium aceticum]
MESSSCKTITTREMTISIEDLDKGMIIGKDIVVNDTNILVKEGYKIKNEDTIRKVQRLLQQYNVEDVFVKIEEEAAIEVKIPETDKVPQDKEIIENNVEKKDFSQQAYSKILEISNKKDAELIDRLIPDAKKNITEKMLLLFNNADASETNSIEEDLRKSMEVINASINVPQLLEKIKMTDDSLFFYSYSTALTAYMLGNWMGWDQKKRENLYITAMLADIGMLNLPEDKRRREQWANEDSNEYYQHVIHSQRLLTKCSFITTDMLKGILHHHEKYDGSGYPRGLTGKSIPLLSRMIYIADLYTFYTVSKRYNALYTINTIREHHLREVDADIFFTLSKRISDYFIGQKFQSRNPELAEGRIITIDQGTGSTVFDQTNMNVYVQQKDQSIVSIPLNSFCRDNVEFI